MGRQLTTGLALFALCVFTNPARSDEAKPPKQLDRLASEFEDLRGLLKIPGISAAVLKDQQLIWARGFGFADLEQREPANENTPYPIASLTKTFAATLLLQLLEQKKLTLDDPLKMYYPPHFETERVKVRHILTHTAAAFSGGKPGDKYEYSGSFFGYVGFVIQKCSGKSFRDVLVTKILEPLDMSDSVPGHNVLDAPDAAADAPGAKARARYEKVLKRLAKPYTLYGADENILSPYPPRWIGASAGLISTVVDLAKYDIALDRNVLLKKETQDLAWTPATANNGDRLPYGLGWFVQDHQGTKLVWHYGQWPTFSALILKVPEKRLTLILLANSTGLSSPFQLAVGDVMKSPFALAFLRVFVCEDVSGKSLPTPSWQLGAEAFSKQVGRLEREAAGFKYDWESNAHVAALSYLASRLARVRKEVKVDSKILGAYVGRYAIDAKQTVTITRRGDRLYGEFPGEPEVELFPESETQFFVKIADVQVSFAKGIEGQVSYLTLRRSGKEQKAKKLE